MTGEGEDSGMSSHSLLSDGLSIILFSMILGIAFVFEFRF